MPIPISTFNDCGRAEFVSALGGIFEGSPWIAEGTFGKRPFRDRDHLHSELCATMRQAERERRLELIRAHPDLAGRLSRAADLTAESRNEQASAGLDQLDERATVELRDLNRAYREHFGFPFVLCARLNDQGSILSSLRTRFANGEEDEVGNALAEIEKIAALRLADLVA